MSWNIRGLNCSLKQSGITSLITKYKVVVLGILETRIKEGNWCDIWKRFQLPQWSLVHNYSSSDQGRIWIIFDSRRVSITVIEEQMQFIHCKVNLENNVFYWTCVYGSYDLHIRRNLWRDLMRLGKGLSKPWLIQGDFNAVSSNEDRLGGNPVNSEAASDFQDWILGLDLVEVQRNGAKFT